MADTDQTKPYIVFARRWRPQTFDEVVGQSHISEQLKNAVESSRVGHAFLFRGPRGVGKTSMARILAKALNCADGPTPTPCGTCEHCRAVASGNAMDVIEIDAATHTQVEEMRGILQTVSYSPASMRHKIYIVDEVHMLSRHSFNALLKTLEEPPAAVKFIFATTDPQKIPETIRSRCQDFEFHRISTEDIVERLGQILDAEPAAEIEDGQRAAVLEALARHAEGGMRDAQVALDQLISLSSGNVTVEATRRLLGLIEDRILLETVRAIQASDSARLLRVVDNLVESGSDLETFVKSLMQFVRDLLVLRAAPDQEGLTDIPSTWMDEIRGLLPELQTATLLNLGHQLFGLAEQMKSAGHMRFLVEFFFIKLTTVGSTRAIDEVIRALESGETLSAPAAAPQSREAPTDAPAQAVNPESDPLAAPPPAVTRVLKKVADPTDLSLLWRELTNLLWGKSPRLKNYLENGRPVTVTEDVLTIGIPSEDNLYLRRLRRPENTELIGSLLEQLTDRRFSVKFVTVDAEATPILAESEPAPSRPPSGPDEDDEPRPRGASELLDGHPFLRHVHDVFQCTGVKLVRRPTGSHP